MNPREPEPVKLLHGILYADEERLQRAKEKLSEQFGAIDYYSPAFPFQVTDYYAAEMGLPLWRLFVSHEPLIQPNQLAAIKLLTNKIESELTIAGSRTVNIDAGYMDVGKVVLASAKYNVQKIYLDHGIYADLTLYYEKGRFHPYPWSFPDFRSSEYNRAFSMIHERYKVQHKRWLQQQKRAE